MEKDLRNEGLSRNGAIDWLRAAAVVLVMFYHGNLAYKGLGTFAGLGWVGVDLFFVLSGLLVSQSWIRKPLWSVYLKKRAWRVLPAYYATLLIGLALVFLFSSETPKLMGQYLKELAMALVYMSNLKDDLLLGPFWSLSVEVHLWLLLPLLVAFLQRYGKRWPMWTLTGLLVVPVIVRSGLALGFPDIVGNLAFPDDAHPSGAFGAHVYSNTFAHMDAFLVGVWISVQGRELHLSKVVQRTGVLIGAVALVLSIPFKTYAPRPLLLVLFQFTGLALGFGTLAAWAWIKGQQVKAPKCVGWLSERIYSLYLSQAVIYFVMTPFLVASRKVGLPGQAAILATFIALTCILGDQLHRWVEDRLLHGWIRKEKPLAGERGAGPGITLHSQEFQNPD